MQKLEGNKKSDTVHILGTSNSLASTVWDNKKEDYWACYAVASEEKIILGHRIDAWFELHSIETWGLYENRILETQEKYPDSIFYMQKKQKNVKNSIEYPLSDVQSMVDNIYLRKYFTSTLSYMVALAIYMGYKKIILNGVSMAVKEEEYSMQKSCVEAWLNFGLGRGIQYEIAQPAALMACNHLYGYEPHKDVIIKLVQTKEAVSAAYNHLNSQLRQMELDVAEQRGGLTALNLLIENFNGGSLGDITGADNER